MRFAFTEIQTFPKWISTVIHLIFLPITGFLLYGIYIQVIKGESFGTSPASDTELFILISLIGVLYGFLIWLFNSMVLHTAITSTDIHIEFRPFVKKSISWNTVKSAEVINYGFVGGWGIRLWTRYGTVYNVKGNKGLHIIQDNGKELLVGTQKEDKLRKILADIKATGGLT